MKRINQSWLTQPENKQDWLNLNMKDKAIWYSSDLARFFIMGMLVGFLIGLMF